MDAHSYVDKQDWHRTKKNEAWQIRWSVEWILINKKKQPCKIKYSTLFSLTLSPNENYLYKINTVWLIIG